VAVRCEKGAPVSHKKIFRFEAKQDPFRIVFACSSENNGPIFSLRFASIFRFVSLPQRYFHFMSILNEKKFFNKYFLCSFFGFYFGVAKPEPQGVTSIW
jgi:hypothetical protein